MSHKFSIGQEVRFISGGHERIWAGLYTVEAWLPEERGDRQYRIKRVESEQRRVVREDQISAPTAATV